jgi:cellulose synthase/poly-beta-1,6-N-acetylglucosamine synthase-like glycosyltransferase
MKLSVVMITYNHEQYIAQAIESILAQNVNFEYEIVIGEDYSTDGTRAVVMAFHRRYPDRIRLLLRDQNVGAMRNFVETIETCHGEYLALQRISSKSRSLSSTPILSLQYVAVAPEPCMKRARRILIRSGTCTLNGQPGHIPLRTY